LNSNNDIQLAFDPIRLKEYTTKYIIKPEKTSKLIESVVSKLKNEQFQNDLEGLEEKEKNRKEFNKLFGA
jgi:hypothetical protein